MISVTNIISNLTKRLRFILDYICYEFVFGILGGRSMIEDILMKSKNKCDIVDRTGEIAVVTGGARGIGAALVKKLLKCQMTVIIGCRDIGAGLKTVESFRKQGIITGKATFYKLDLESLESVREFANNIKKDHQFLNVIVNNAGIMFPPYRETRDGYESQFAVNYLAPFYLTHLLMPLLNKTSSSRVVNVTSCAHFAARNIHFDDINMKKRYLPNAAYAQSKLCSLLSTIELDRRLREQNSNVYILAVHPGIVNTDLFDGTPIKKLFPWVLKYFSKDVDAGATSVLAPCISPLFNNKGGIYTSNCCEVPTSKLAQDIALQRELFDYSLKALSIESFGV